MCVIIPSFLKVVDHWMELGRILPGARILSFAFITAAPFLGMAGRQNGGFIMNGTVIPGNQGLAVATILAWHTAAGPEHIYMVGHRAFRANAFYKLFVQAWRLMCIVTITPSLFRAPQFCNSE